MKKLLFIPIFFSCIMASAQSKFTSLQEVLDYADVHAVAIQSAMVGEQIAAAWKKGGQIIPPPPASMPLPVTTTT